MPHLLTAGAPILQVPVYAVAFFFLSVALGRRIQIWLGPSSGGTPSERAIAQLGLGAGALQLVPLALGAAGVLGERSLRFAILGVAGLLLPDLYAVGRGIRANVTAARIPPRWLLAWALALIPGLVVAGLLALTPTIDPDGMGYHLTVIKRWLSSGSLDYLPSYPNSNMPMGVEMLFMTALSFAGDAAAKGIHYSFAIAGAVGLCLAGARLKSRMVGVVAATLFLFGPLGVSQLMGWAYLEGVTGFASIAAVLAWLIWFDRREPGWLRTSLLLAGIGTSFKITAGLLPISLIALTLAMQVVEARERIRGIEWLRLLVLCALPVSPWLLRAAIVTGNPVFPMLASVIPSRDFPPALATQWEYFNRYINWAIVIGARWSIAQRKEILFFSACGIALLGGFVYRSLAAPTARAACVVVTATVLIQLGAVGLYLRYWIPLASVLMLPLLALAERALSGRRQQWLLVLATLLLSLFQGRRALRTVDGDVGGLVRTSLGLDGQLAFLSRHNILLPLYQEVNHDLPSDARVLLACNCSGFYVDRTTYCVDTVEGSFRLTSFAAFVADLVRLHVTHVISPRTLAEGGPPPSNDPSGVGFMVRDDEVAVVGRLLQTRARLLGSAADQGLYAIDLSPAVTPP